MHMTSQWLHASEETLILQAQANQPVYSGHKYSERFPPSILHGVSYCLPDTP